MTAFSVCSWTRLSILSDLQCLLLGGDGQLIRFDVTLSPDISDHLVYRAEFLPLSTVVPVP
jgi:hypothetical protein